MKHKTQCTLSVAIKLTESIKKETKNMIYSVTLMGFPIHSQTGSDTNTGLVAFW